MEVKSSSNLKYLSFLQREGIQLVALTITAKRLETNFK